MDDLISRQAAIEALMKRDKELRKLNWYDKPWAECECNGIDYALGLVSALPSAQPEIIRCKDCKYGDTFHEFDEPDMPMKCLGQHYGGTYPDDFCSYAERRNE